MYRYNAICTRVVDGDTVWLQVDLGFRTQTITDFRLAGINAPELHAPDPIPGAAAKAFLESLITAKALVIDTYRAPDKYGRWLVDIYLGDPDDRMTKHVNQMMIDSGNAVVYHG